MGLGDSQVALDILLNAVDNTKEGVESGAGRLGKLGDVLGGVAKIATATAGAAFAFGGIAVKVFNDAGEAAHEMSTKFGMSAEQASSWLAAGRSLNISNDTLMTGFQQLTRTMNGLDLQLATTGKLSKTQTEVFRELGVNVLDAHGKMRPLNDVMLAISTRFAAMPDGAAKAGLAMKIFGRSGTDMIPFLDQGGARLKEFMATAQQYGAVVGQDDVEATRSFHLQLAEVKLRAEGVLITFARGLMPALGTVFAVINGMVMPSLLTFSQWFAKEGAPRIQDFAIKVATTGERELPKLWAGAKAVLSQLQPMVEPLKQIASQLIGLLPAVGQASNLMSVWGSATSMLPSLLNLVVLGLKLASPLIKLMADNVNVLIPAIYAVIAAYTAWKVIQFAKDVQVMALAYRSLAAEEGILAAVNSLLGISFGPITIAIIAIGVVVALFALAWKNNWGDIQGKTQAVVSFLGGVVGGMVAFFRVAIPAILNTVTGLWNGITTTLGNIANWLITWGPFILVLLTGPIGLAALFIIGHFSQIKDGVVGFVSGAIGIIRGLWGIVTGLLTGPVQAAAGALSGIWNGITKAATGAWNDLLGAAKRIFGSIGDAITGIFSSLHIPLPHFTFGSKKENVAGVNLTVPDIGIKWYGTGGNFIATKPTMFGAGEAGPEVVTIKPLGAVTAGATSSGASLSFDETNKILRAIGQVLTAQRQILQRIADDPNSINSTSATRRFAV